MSKLINVQCVALTCMLPWYGASEQLKHQLSSRKIKAVDDKRNINRIVSDF